MTTQMLTPGEVAERLGFDVVTVRRWIHAGKLPAVRTPGGHLRVKVSDLDAMLTKEMR